MQGNRLLAQSEGRQAAVFPFKSRKMKQILCPLNAKTWTCQRRLLLLFSPTTTLFKPYLSESAYLVLFISHGTKPLSLTNQPTTRHLFGFNSTNCCFNHPLSGS